MKFYLPILLVVASNTIYHLSAKSTPENVNTFAALSVTYLVSAAVTLLLFFTTQKQSGLLAEYRHLNWSSFALGLAIVGLEVGYILAYKVGWSVSTAQITGSAMLAVVLVILGFLLYKEVINLQKVIGIVVCLVGLYIINK